MITEKIGMLLEYFQDDVDVLDMLHDTLESCNHYVNVVVNMENTQKIIRFRLSAEEYKEKLKELDITRRFAHNACISSIKSLNRICRNTSLPAFYEGDEENRYEIADFSLEVVAEIFKNRKQ